MCFSCCGSSECGRCCADIFYVLEKLSSFFAFTAVVCCVIVTITFVLVTGIGLGYNYCVVENKVSAISGGTTPSGLRSGQEKMEEYSYRRTPSRTHRRTFPIPMIKPTMVLPLHEELDLKALFAKLRAGNNNITLELIT